jgi:hypothetical protein
MTIHAGNPPALATASNTVIRVDANGTMLRLRALHAMGHGSRRIARATGHPEHAIRKIVRGDARTITPAVRDAITALYDQWWDKRPPERTPAEKTATRTALRRAAAAEWCAGAALDDDELDAPGYRPGAGFRPACGTGIAPDITTRADRADGQNSLPAPAVNQDPQPRFSQRCAPAKEAQIA